MNAELVRRLADTGDALISSTQLGGRYALRLCMLNHTTGADDVGASSTGWRRSRSSRR